MTTHTYRGYQFDLNNNTASIITTKGLERLPVGDVLRYIDAAWNKFDRPSDRPTVAESNDLVKEALAVAINSWEYDGEHDKAKAAGALMSNATQGVESPDWVAGASYVVDYIENELGIDLSDTGLAEYRDLNI